MSTERSNSDSLMRKHLLKQGEHNVINDVDVNLNEQMEDIEPLINKRVKLPTPVEPSVIFTSLDDNFISNDEVKPAAIIKSSNDNTKEQWSQVIHDEEDDEEDDEGDDEGDDDDENITLMKNFNDTIQDLIETLPGPNGVNDTKPLITDELSPEEMDMMTNSYLH